jgi:hypothetical protein
MIRPIGADGLSSPAAVTVAPQQIANILRPRASASAAAELTCSGVSSVQAIPALPSSLSRANCYAGVMSFLG